MSPEVIFQGVVSGLLIGFLYALIAVGLSLIFGLMEIVNFAHGEFLMVSMFTAFWLYTLFGLDPLVSIPICAAVLFLLGVGVYKGIIAKVLRGPMLGQVFATFGLGIVLRAAAQFAFSPNYRQVQHPLLSGRFDLGGIFLPTSQVVSCLFALVAFGLLWLFVTRTDLGIALQAVSENRDAARLMGIDSDRMFMLGWGIGALCVGVAGALLSNFYYVYPDVGFTFGLIAYIVVALGGFGSIFGSLVAGVLIGLAEILGGLLISSAFKYVIVFSLYLVVVFIRPQGLFGRY